MFSAPGCKMPAFSIGRVSSDMLRETTKEQPTFSTGRWNSLLDFIRFMPMPRND